VRWLRTLGKIVAFGVVTIVAVAVAAVAALQVQPVQQWLLAKINQSMAGEARLSGFSGTIPTDMAAAKIELEDPAGRWAVIDQAALKIDPGALLRGRITIGLLAARDIRVERRPQSSGTRSNSRSSLPLPVELRRLDLGSIELAPPVLGEQVVLSAVGNAELSSGRTEAHLAIHRLDNGPGHLDARLDLSGRPPQLHIAMNVDDPSGKVLDTVLARSDHLPLSVRLTGDGPLDNWHGRLAAAAGDAAGIDVNLSLFKADGYRVAIDGQAEAAALLPPSLRDAVGNRATFRLSGMEKPDGTITADALKLDLAAATLDGSAAIGGGADGPVKADIAIRAPDLGKLSSLLGRAATGSARLRLDLSGTKQKPAASADLEAKALGLAGSGASDVAAHVKAQTTGVLGDPQSRMIFSGGGQVAGIVAKGAPLPSGADRVTWTLMGSADPAAKTVAIKSLAAEASGMTVTARGDADFADKTLSGSLHAAAADLSRLSGLAGRSIAGRGAIDATASREASGVSQLRVTGRLADLATGLPMADALLGGRLDLDIVAQRAANGDLDLENASIDAANLHADGKATIDSASNRVDGTFALDLPRLDALGTRDRPASGRAHLVGTISGTAAAPHLDAMLDAADVSSGGIRMDRVKARLDASKDPAPAGDLHAEFQSGKLAGELNGSFALSGDGKALDLPKLSFRAGGTRLTAALHTALDSRLTNGDIDARSTDLSELSNLVGTPLSGTMALRTTLTANEGQGATFSLSAAKLSLGSPGARNSVERITAKGRLSDLLRTPAGQGNLELRQAKFGDAVIDSLRGSFASHGAGRFGFTTALEGSFRAPIELAAAGDVDLARDGVAARIAKFDGKLGDQALRLERPLRLAKSGSDLSLSDLDLALGNGRVTGDAALKGESVAAKLSARDVPLALAEAFAGKGAIGGTAGADLDLGGTVARPTGRVAITARGLRLAAATRPDQPPVAVSAEARLLPGRVALDGRIALPKGEAITITGEVPVRISQHPYGATVPRHEPFALRAEGDGKLEDIADLLPIGEDKLSGQYHLDLRASGTVASPNAAGQVTLSNGHYESLAYGTVLSGMTLDLVGNRDRIVLRRFSATDGSEGRLDISGTSLLTAKPAPAFDITAALRKFQLVHRDEAVAHGSGDLHITGNMAEPRVMGEFRVDDAQFYLPDRLPPSVRKLDATEIDSTTGAVFKQAAPPSNTPPVVAALDLTVDIPGQVFVRGRGLDSEWHGHFHVTGTSSAPQINGALEVVHGTMNFLGKTLTLSRGRITLVGGSKIEPLVDFLAQSTSANITAEVAVTGPAEHPKITLTSNPPLPQDQILAQLLFGREATQLSPLEGAQIAAAAAALASGGPSVIDRVRMKFGLDRLSLGSADQTAGATAGAGASVPPAAAGSSGASGVGNTAVSAGKYVAPGVYVGVNQSATGESQAQMEVEVTRHVDVDTTASANRGNSVGVEWKLDY
jgi:translocation and assembly module TamB